jgi:hypothetical protein
MGPRGFNGTQGPQGPQGLPGLQGPEGVQGVGNLSACIVDEKVVHGTLAFQGLGKVTVSYDKRPVRTTLGNVVIINLYLGLH